MYRIQFRKVDSGGGYTVVDVDTPNTTSFTVGGLELGTEYVFGIMAYNVLGGSTYLQDAASAVTLSKFMLLLLPSRIGVIMVLHTGAYNVRITFVSV